MIRNGQGRVHAQQDNGRKQDQHHAFDNAQNRPSGQEADALDILHGAGQDLSRFGAVVEREGKRR